MKMADGVACSCLLKLCEDIIWREALQYIFCTPLESDLTVQYLLEVVGHCDKEDQSSIAESGKILTMAFYTFCDGLFPSHNN